MNTLYIKTFINDEKKIVPHCVCFILNNLEYFIYINKKNLIIELLDLILKENNSNQVEFYTHNLNFDGMLIIDSISLFKIYFEIFSLKTNIYWIKIFYSGITILFRCSRKIIPLSLEEIGEIDNFKNSPYPYLFITEKTINYIGKMPDYSYWENNFNNGSIKELFDVKKETIEHCLKNVKILFNSLDNLFKIIKLEDNHVLSTNFSTPSISHYIFFKKYNKAGISKKLSKKDDAYIRNSFFGGRNEVFGNQRDDEHVKYYDFSGMYSQCMLESFHNGKSEYCVPNNFKDPGFYTISFISENMYLPILPRRLNRGELLFSNGYGSGTYWFEEIKYFIENGGTVTKIHHALIYSSYDQVFKEFVDRFIEIRKKGGYHNIFGKLMINSLYGSTALNNINSLTYISYSEEEVEGILNNLTVTRYSKINSAIMLIIEKDEKYKKVFGKSDLDKTKRNVSIASAITSKARIKLHKFFKEIEEDGGKLLYCDTDSAFASYPRTDTRTHIRDKKWLMFYKKTIFASSKSYALFNEEKGLQIRIKGTLEKKICFKDFEQAFYNQFEKKKNLTKEDFIKNIDFSRYNKREFSNDKKNTYPLTINN